MLMLVVTCFSGYGGNQLQRIVQRSLAAYLPASVLSTVRMRRVRPESPSPPHLADAHVDHRRMPRKQIGARLIHAGGWRRRGRCGSD